MTVDYLVMSVDSQRGHVGADIPPPQPPQVGAAISMTYITGQPIVFVGTGQTYNDLRSLNARAVVSALMKA